MVCSRNSEEASVTAQGRGAGSGRMEVGEAGASRRASLEFIPSTVGSIVRLRYNFH